MYRKLLIVASLCLISSLSFAQPQKNKKADMKSAAANYKAPGSPMPALRYFRRDGVLLTNKDLNKKAPVIIMLFNPTCEHCEDEARMLEANLKSFKETTLLLMAADRMLSYIPYFVTNVKADEYPSLQIGVDSSDFINQTFLYQSLPQINIYDEQRRLVKIFTGTTPVDSFQAYIR